MAQFVKATVSKSSQYAYGVGAVELSEFTSRLFWVGWQALSHADIVDGPFVEAPAPNKHQFDANLMLSIEFACQYYISDPKQEQISEILIRTKPPSYVGLPRPMIE